MNYLVTDTSLSAVADAIRTKGGTSASLAFPSGFVSAINSIETGGGGISVDDIAMRSISGVISGSANMISGYTFYYCRGITEVNFPSCSLISAYAFYSCSSLVSVSFPTCKTIQGQAFGYCTSLSKVFFPQCTTLSNYAFAGCSHLENVSFPACTIIGSYAFQLCSALNSVYFSNCTNIYNYAFVSCTKLTKVKFPICTHIGSGAFYSCYNLETAIFSHSENTGGTIYTSAFRSCFHLTSLYLLASIVYKLSASATFSSTPILAYTASTGGVRGSIFVPESLYNAYISSTNWAVFSSRFVSLTDAQVSYVLEHGTHVIP